MVDHQAETEIGTIKPGLEVAITGLGGDLRDELKENGAVTLDELLTSVYKWEEEYGKKLTDKEFEVLEFLSLVLAASKVKLIKTVGAKVSNKDKEKAFMQSIGAQQLIVKTVIANIDSDGRPNKAVMKSLSLTTEIFDGYFDFENPRITDLGVESQASNWQGFQGMVTTALLFHEAGWKVDLPEAKLDLRYDVDLKVTSPSGKMFAVDVTARSPRTNDDGTLSSPFRVGKGRVPTNLAKEDEMRNLRGFIEVNVPPMRHRSSYAFYENRLAGYPSKNSFIEFRQIIDKFS